MNRWLVTVSVGLIVVCCELSCIMSSAGEEKNVDGQWEEQPSPIDVPSVGDSGPFGGQGPEHDAGFQPIRLQNHRGDLQIIQKDAGQAGQDVIWPDDMEPEPNAMLIATCETEPDEIAVPLNALDNRYCDTVQARAYHADETGAYEVTANYVWSIANTSVADIHPLPGNEHEGIQRPSVAYDVFWSDDPDTEPETTITVCAEPKAGWQNAQQPDLCRTLPLRAVVNLDAAWCFSGATFDSVCDAWLVVQDGRYLTIDGDGVGSVFARGVHFYKGDFYYEGTLTSDTFMTGTVTRTDTDPHELVGTWQADRMSP